MKLAIFRNGGENARVIPVVAIFHIGVAGGVFSGGEPAIVAQ
jgi:hypothetical protein